MNIILFYLYIFFTYGINHTVLYQLKAWQVYIALDYLILPKWNEVP